VGPKHNLLKKVGPKHNLLKKVGPKHNLLKKVGPKHNLLKKVGPKHNLPGSKINSCMVGKLTINKILYYCPDGEVKSTAYGR